MKASVGMEMVRLMSIDETSSEYTVSLKMAMEWEDHRLRTTNNQTGDLKMLTINTEYFRRVWSPCMSVPNLKEPGSVELIKEGTITSFMIQSDGLVYVRAKYVLVFSCFLPRSHAIHFSKKTSHYLKILRLI